MSIWISDRHEGPQDRSHSSRSRYSAGPRAPGLGRRASGAGPPAPGLRRRAGGCGRARPEPGRAWQTSWLGRHEGRRREAPGRCRAHPRGLHRKPCTRRALRPAEGPSAAVWGRMLHMAHKATAGKAMMGDPGGASPPPPVIRCVWCTEAGRPAAPPLWDSTAFDFKRRTPHFAREAAGAGYLSSLRDVAARASSSYRCRTPSSSRRMIRMPGTPRIHRSNGTIEPSFCAEGARWRVTGAGPAGAAGVTAGFRVKGEVVGGTGLEPVASCMSSMCSNQLS